MANVTVQDQAKQSLPSMKSSGFRSDIQGIRAVAVLAVLLYHARMPWLPGGFVGVDVFFVISGFLITGGIVKELRQTGRLSLKDFYIRRIARILPAASATLLATVTLTWLLLPETRWVQVGRDAVSSGLYFVNWLFANSAVDYLAQDQAPSPLQHFWSLAVEEQFYIVWPVLLMAVGWLSLKLRFSIQRGLLAALTMVAMPSLAWSIYDTAINPGGAYFVTTTRMWELAIGASLAIAAGRAPTPPKLVAAVVGWTGLGAILSATLFYTGALPFPSYTALLPTLGAAAIIWSGQAAGESGPGRLLSLPPMVKIGEISYSLYLLHWPLFIIVGALVGELSLTAGLVVMLASMVLAWLSTRFIEKPAQSAILGFRGSLGQSWPKLAFGSLFTVVAVLPAVILVLAVPTSQLATAGGKGPVGAELLAAGGKLTVVEAFPTEELAATAAATDLPVVNTNGCMLDHPTVAPKVCSFGDLGSDNVIALVGDSHAAMFIPGLEVVAKEAGYRLDTYTKGSCPFVTLPIDFQKRHYKECGQWVRNVTDKLVKEKPVAVITAMSRAYSVFGTGLSIDESRQPISDSLGASWDRLEGAGIRVAAMRDVPRPGIVVPDCVSANSDNLSKCAVNQDKSLWEDGPEVRAAKTHPGVTIIDLTSAMCAEGVCPAVINGIVVYRDSNHITATYSRSMHQQMAESLRGVLR